MVKSTLFAKLPDYVSTPDGMAIDFEGNLILACPNYADQSMPGCILKIDKDKNIKKCILAFGLEWLMYDAMVVKVAEVDTLQLFSFVPFSQLLWPMVLTFSAAGLFVSIVGSWSSIRKFLDV